MTTSIDPRNSKRLLFMKVGDHAGEPWEKILERKQREKERTGKIFWGYGGSACHPLTQVRPFARMSLEVGERPILVMQRINSAMDQGMYAAEEYSVDGVKWEKIPDGIMVTGSRYAMVLDEIVPGDFMFDAADYEVGIGPNRGKRADEYLRGRTDKACLVRVSQGAASISPEEASKTITAFAALKDPFAVMLR